MPKRICIQCKNLYDKESAPGQRCPECQDSYDTQRDARPSSSARGLGWAFTRRKAADPAYQQATRCQCQGCGHCGPGGCGRPFTRDNPKTAQHTVPRSRGGQASPILAFCRSCNSSQGGQLSRGSQRQ